MNKKEFVTCIEESPIIAAVNSDRSLQMCLDTDVSVVFILYGDIVTIPGIVKKIKDSGRVAMVHMDLVEGLATKNISVDFIKECTEADGIITTKSGLIPRAKELGLSTVLRHFILDSMAIKNVEKQEKIPGYQQPDVIEILPGVLAPKLMKQICRTSRLPVIAGGLIKDREDVINALNNGCSAISTTCGDVWKM